MSGKHEREKIVVVARWGAGGKQIKALMRKSRAAKGTFAAPQTEEKRSFLNYCGSSLRCRTDVQDILEEGPGKRGQPRPPDCSERERSQSSCVP